MLAADPDRQLGVGGPAALDRDPHQLADALLVERRERVVGEHAVLEVVREELALRVVAREAERRLRQVVRAEREEVRVAAISSARMHARGSSIIVPTRYGRSQPSSAATRTRQLAQPAQLLGEARRAGA